MLENLLSSTINTFGIILTLMIIDVVLGIIKAIKLKNFTSNKLRNTLSKVIVYFTTLIIGASITAYGHIDIQVIFATFLCIVEGISIVENLSILFPNNILISKIGTILKKESDKICDENKLDYKSKIKAKK